MSVEHIDLNFVNCTTVQERIDKINLIITSLLDTAVRSVARGDKIEYSIDTGQSKERVVFSSMDAVTKAIREYEDLKVMYQNQITGGSFRNMDERFFR